MPPRSRTRKVLGSAAALALVATGTAACSGSAVKTPRVDTKTRGSTAPVKTSAAYKPPACRPTPPAQPIHAVPVPGVPAAWNVTSFDGTVIRAYWFPISADGSVKAPTVLMGPGWGMLADTNPSAPALFGGLSIDGLHKAGFNVLTWDPRGFPPSGGQTELDSPAYEGRDVQQLIDWIATLPGVTLDGPDDPAIGMVGASYGGGIQLTAAEVDCRIDAIVPTIAWNSLVTSLYPDRTVKSGWLRLLLAGATPLHLDPRIVSAESSVTTGLIDPKDIPMLTSESPAPLMAKIHAPTLIIQGTVDNLFPLAEGIANYRALKARGVPVKMIWFCGGHGACLTPPGHISVVTRATIAWLDRYVKHHASVSTGPGFQFVDQNGMSYASASYPLNTTTPLTASGHANLTLVATGGSGPATLPKDNHDMVASVAVAVTPAYARHAVNVKVVNNRDAMVIGSPRLSLTYKGTTPPGSRPTRVFAQIVDDSTGLVLGNQITPIDITLDGRRHETTVSLNDVVASLHPGDDLTLQLVATTVAFAQPRLGGKVSFNDIHLSLPVAAGLKPRGSETRPS